MSKRLRLLAVVACVAMLAAFGCRRGQPETTEEPTEEPSPTPSVESLGEFQLIGTVQQAFLDVEPGIDIPQGEQAPLEEGTGGRESTSVPGVMRLSLEAFSDNLRDRCSADPEDRFNLYWTPDTLFDPLYVNATDIEVRLDGRELGIIGTAYMRPQAGAGEEFGLDSPTPAGTEAASSPDATPDGSPDPSPGASDLEGEQDCVLVAEQVGTSEGELPTPRPQARPTPTRTPSGSPPTGTANNN